MNIVLFAIKTLTMNYDEWKLAVPEDFYDDEPEQDEDEAYEDYREVMRLKDL
jgi:hypothetical protein